MEKSVLERQLQAAKQAKQLLESELAGLQGRRGEVEQAAMSTRGAMDELTKVNVKLETTLGHVQRELQSAHSSLADRTARVAALEADLAAITADKYKQSLELAQLGMERGGMERELREAGERRRAAAGSR